MVLCILSYIVKGLSSIQKRWLALKEFRSSGANVVMLQETHFLCRGSMKFASKYFPSSYLSSDSTGKAEMAILIKKNFIRVKSANIDSHGRFIILVCDYMSSSFTLVNVYVPNSGQIDFLNGIFESVHYHSQPFMIIVDDFNLVMSPTRDRQALFLDTLPQKVASQATSFHKCIRSHQLFDSWRIKHPSTKKFTFYSMAHKMYSRLDHFFILVPLIPHIVEPDISPIT